MVQINIQRAQSTDYTMLINDLCRFQFSDSIKYVFGVRKALLPLDFSCKLEFVIEGHRTAGFAGKAEVQPGASVGITCLDSQCRK